MEWEQSQIELDRQIYNLAVNYRRNDDKEDISVGVLSVICLCLLILFLPLASFLGS